MQHYRQAGDIELHKINYFMEILCEDKMKINWIITFLG